MNVRGIFFTVVSAILFGITPALARVVYDLGGNALTLTFYRNLMVVPILFSILYIRKIDFRVTKKEFQSITLVGVGGIGLTTLLLYSSYEYIGISTATTLHFMYPVFVALLCRIFYKEKLSRTKTGVLIVASFGVIFFLEREGMGAMAYIGILLAVISGLTYAYYMMAMEKKGLTRLNPLKVSFYMAIAISCAMLLYHIPTKQLHFVLSPKALLLIFVIAVCTSFIAVAFLQIGIQNLSATTAAIFSLFEPVTSNLAGILFLGEKMSLAKTVGIIIILGAAATLAILDSRPKRKKIVKEEDVMESIEKISA